jgi:uncharacterized phiE125 gp8 family phage protein
MSVTQKTIDRTVLPEAFLPDVKEQVNVDFTDDDRFITRAIAQAIDLLEIATGLSIFSATYEWKPDVADTFTVGGALVPLSPVKTLTWKNDAGTDVTADLVAVGNSVPGRAGAVYVSRQDGVELSGSYVGTATVGFATLAEVPPALQDIIVRVAAHLYENREAVSSINLNEVPGIQNDILAGHWVPRA